MAGKTHKTRTPPSSLIGFEIYTLLQNAKWLAEAAYLKRTDRVKSYVEKAETYRTAYKNYLRNKSVAIIGPAPSLEKKSLGRTIDQFDIIIRPNAQLPYAQHLHADYGSRTDVLYSNMMAYNRHTNYAALNALDFVCTAFPSTGTFSRSNYRFLQYKAEKLQYREMPAELFAYTKRKYGLFPNTGLIAILDLLRMPVSKLLIAGFTFYRGNKLYTDKGHAVYSDKKTNRLLKGGIFNKGHHPEKQWDAFIEELAQPRQFPIICDPALQRMLEDAGIGTECLEATH